MSWLNCWEPERGSIQVVSSDAYNSEIACHDLGMKVGKSGANIKVSGVEPGGPADKCGRIKESDLILEIDGRRVFGMTSNNDLRVLLLGREGDPIKLKLMRREGLSGEVYDVFLQREKRNKSQPQDTDEQKPFFSFFGDPIANLLNAVTPRGGTEGTNFRDGTDATAGPHAEASHCGGERGSEDRALSGGESATSHPAAADGFWEAAPPRPFDGHANGSAPGATSRSWNLQADKVTESTGFMSARSWIEHGHAPLREAHDDDERGGGHAPPNGPSQPNPPFQLEKTTILGSYSSAPFQHDKQTISGLYTARSFDRSSEMYTSRRHSMDGHQGFVSARARRLVSGERMILVWVKWAAALRD